MNRALVIKTYGDNDIASAIVDGIKAGTVKHDPDWGRVAALVRVAVGNTKTPEDYACMVVKSSYEHRTQKHGRMYAAILGAWALLWLSIVGWYDYLSAINREA